MDPNDLRDYPRPFARDLELLQSAGADFLLFPEYESLYPDSFRFRVQESELSQALCGAHRSGGSEWWTSRSQNNAQIVNGLG